jgi:sulfite reductase (NADPH) hemoprotein beta-component
VGGGLGRTPIIGQVLTPFLPEADLLPYVEAILSAYNSYGRRDNKYKARIKIMVQELGLEEVRAQVERRFAALRPEWQGADRALLRDLQAAFAPPTFHKAPTDSYDQARNADPIFRAWADTNLHAHRADGYAIVTVSLKAHGETPGDATSAQMRALADLAETYGHGELRISHEQNVILPHVHKSDLPALHARLRAQGLGTANIGLISDIIACPGMDYCALATARSIPVAQDIAEHFRARELDIGAMKIKISGCINACGHHHLGHIGILGLDRAGVENYQITLGGDATETAALGQRTGPGFAHDQVIPALDRLVNAYLALRDGPSESFIDTLRRLGHEPFKAALYERGDNARAA